MTPSKDLNTVKCLCPFTWRHKQVMFAGYSEPLMKSEVYELSDSDQIEFIIACPCGCECSIPEF
jgi:hypothetical protein